VGITLRKPILSKGNINASRADKMRMLFLIIQLITTLAGLTLIVLGNTRHRNEFLIGCLLLLVGVGFMYANLLYKKAK
jgi:hypothetical protein